MYPSHLEGKDLRVRGVVGTIVRTSFMVLAMARVDLYAPVGNLRHPTRGPVCACYSGENQLSPSRVRLFKVSIRIYQRPDFAFARLGGHPSNARRF